MFNIKNALILNFLGTVLLVVTFFLKPLPLRIAGLLAGLIYELVINYKIFVSDAKHVDIKQEELLREKWIERLAHAGKRNTFGTERKRLIKSYESLAQRRKFFEALDETDQSRVVYDKALTQCLSDVKSAAQFIENYDYILKPNTRYLMELCADATSLSERVSELVEMLIRVESMADDVEVEKLDYMLESFKTVLEMK